MIHQHPLNRDAQVRIRLVNMSSICWILGSSDYARFLIICRNKIKYYNIIMIKLLFIINKLCIITHAETYTVSGNYMYYIIYTYIHTCICIYAILHSILYIWNTIARRKKFTVLLCHIIIRVHAARRTSICLVPLIYLLRNFDNIAGSDLWLSLSLAYIANKSERRNLARVYLLVGWNCMESVLSGSTSWYEKKYSRSQLRH